MICVSVGEKNWENAAETAGMYPFTEIRLDYLENISESEVEQIFRSGKGLKIATFRKKDSFSDQDRLKMIVSALNAGASYADADINNNESFIKAVSDAAGKAGAKLIISYHNFKRTPSFRELDEIIKKAFSLKGDIVKIACSAETDDEAERLLSLPAVYENIVIAGMGSRGGRIRSLSSAFKSLFTYASPDGGKAVAPGQVPYTELLEKQKRISDEW